VSQNDYFLRSINIRCRIAARTAARQTNSSGALCLRREHVVKVACLEENLAAADVELTAADLREIDAAASKIQVNGQRLPDAVLKFTNG
jgi:hypothetical protein